MFSAILKDLRAKNGYTQGQLAKMLGVSPGNVGDWETGKSKPGYSALASLARIFEVSADYLLELDAAPAKRVTISPRTSGSRGLPVTALRCPKRKPI